MDAGTGVGVLVFRVPRSLFVGRVAPVVPPAALMHEVMEQLMNDTAE
jgi:hypothetical protein